MQLKKYETDKNNINLYSMMYTDTVLSKSDIDTIIKKELISYLGSVYEENISFKIYTFYENYDIEIYITNNSFENNELLAKKVFVFEFSESLQEKKTVKTVLQNIQYFIYKYKEELFELTEVLKKYSSSVLELGLKFKEEYNIPGEIILTKNRFYLKYKINEFELSISKYYITNELMNINNLLK